MEADRKEEKADDVSGGRGEGGASHKSAVTELRRRIRTPAEGTSALPAAYLQQVKVPTSILPRPLPSLTFSKKTLSKLNSKSVTWLQTALQLKQNSVASVRKRIILPLVGEVSVNVCG
jgi:hypothetical protein